MKTAYQNALAGKLLPWQITYADAARMAQSAGMLVAPISACQNCSVHQAYEIQFYNVQKWTQEGFVQVGYKAGLTAEAGQKNFGVDSPIFAALFSQMVWENGCEKQASLLNNPALEVEVAFRISQDITAPVSEAKELLPYIRSASISFEIVSGRLNKPASCAADLLADNCGACGIVIGDGTNDAETLLSLADQKVELYCREKLIQTANTKNILGDPFRSVMWLANTLLEMGTCLRKGDIVMAGSATAGVSAAAGETYTAHCPALGSVQMSFI